MKSKIDPLSMAVMVVTVASFSAAAPLTAAASASPLAMAFWRNCLGFAVLGPFLLLLRRREVVRVARGERGTCAGSSGGPWSSASSRPRRSPSTSRPS
ncbi:hypothetical protein [Streptomyces sp. NPDC060065]|uniref:hypothetical protein n=1 Tax=Streptomyces sp. NPDC060065 TaxID=3347050 RepID=UPI00367CE13F